MSRGSVIADDNDFDEDIFGEDVEEDDSDYLPEEESEESVDSETETPDLAQLQAQIQELTSRMGGLQGSLQKSQEEKQQIQMQFLGMQAQQRHQQLIAAGADPAAAEAQIRGELGQVVLGIQGNNINNERQSLEEAARIILAQQLAIKHGIEHDTPEFKRLVLVKDPEDMTAMAEVIAAKKRSNTRTKQKATRQATQADKFGSGRSPSSPRRKKANSLDEALEQFMSARIRN